VAPDPVIVRWTDHALTKARFLGFAREDVERAVLDGHRSRRRNAGDAEWRVTSGRLVVLYDHPDGDDRSVARIVTLWRRL
jgi:hypothetical protein